MRNENRSNRFPDIVWFTGMIVFALAAFSCTLPHFIFGEDLLQSANAFYGGANRNVASPISTSITVQNTSDIDSYISDIKPSSQMNLCFRNYTENAGIQNIHCIWFKRGN